MKGANLLFHAYNDFDLAGAGGSNCIRPTRSVLVKVIIILSKILELNNYTLKIQIYVKSSHISPS